MVKFRQFPPTCAGALGQCTSAAKFNYLYHNIFSYYFAWRDACKLYSFEIYIHTKYCTKYTWFIYDILYINNRGDLASNISLIFVNFPLKSLVRDCCFDPKLWNILRVCHMPLWWKSVCGFEQRLVFELMLCFPTIHGNIYILYSFACKLTSTNLYCGMLQLIACNKCHMIQHIETSNNITT